jgi:ribonuclease P protein component
MNDAVVVKNNMKPCLTASLTRQHKLTKAIEFKGVFKKPFVSSDALFKVLARINQNDNSRLGMAVSRQIDKRAVGRNRIKRVVRESFRLHRSESRTYLDIVVLPRRQTAAMCNEELFHSLNRHWARLENQFEG